MPVVTISMTEDDYARLKKNAEEEGTSVSGLIRKRMLLTEDPLPYTPAEAVRRAFELYEPGDMFTLPKLFGESYTLNRRAAGVLGKQFRQYVQTKYPEHIRFVGMTDYGRRAQYEIIKKENFNEEDE